MSDEQALSALAARAGIAAHYQDIHGYTRHCRVEVLHRLLDAQGMGVTARQDARQALDEIEDAVWASPLPPVTVLQHPVPAIRLRLHLPESRIGHRLAWRLLEESGVEHGTSFVPQAAAHGARRMVGGITHVAIDLEIAEPLPPGYHMLELLHGKKRLGSMPLILVPRTSYQSDAVREDRRVWGPAVQLYGLRSDRNWGIGDFGDLRRVLEMFAELGADVVGVSPLHALFFGNPQHANPYSPSSRVFLNVLFIDVEAVPDFAESGEAQELVRSVDFQLRLEALRAAQLVEYAAVADAKRQVFELLYRHFREQHLAAGSARAEAFRAFQRGGDRSAAALRPVRDAVGAFSRGRPTGLGLAAVAGRVPRSGRGGGAHLRECPHRARRVLRVPAMAGPPAVEGAGAIVRPISGSVSDMYSRLRRLGGS